MYVWNIVWNMLNSVARVIIAIVALINLIDRKGHNKRRSNAKKVKRRLPKK